MKLLLIPCSSALALALAANSPALGGESPRTDSACGLERWSIKTLMDPAASSLPKNPVDSSIARIVNMKPPADPDARMSRLPPLETTLWRVRARLIGYKLEPDSDFHLVLADPVTGASMVAEIPASYCTASPEGKKFATARANVIRIGHHPAEARHFWWLDYHGATPPTVTIIGYGFWDEEHGQRGASANGAELHPVLSVQSYF
jgi:hypothetical protein